MRPARLLPFLVAASLSFALATPTATPQAPRAARPAPPPAPPVHELPNEKDSVKFGVIGDSGTGDRPQYEVADKLIAAHARFPFTFVIMLGDNLYGRERQRDYVSKFEKPYGALLQAGVKFYASLGNHDDPNQRFYEAFNMGGQRYYTHKQGDVRFFVLDSNYFDANQRTWLERELSGSRDRWKVAYFHHPIYSSGERHGSELDLRREVEPLFVQHGVSVVFAGHEHFYERLKPQQGIAYFTSGGAAKLRRGNLRDNSALTARGFDTDRSCMIVEIAGDTMHFQTIARDGRIVDSGTVPRVVREATAAAR